MIRVLLALLLPSIPASAVVKPYRVLLVIGDQWKDPRSFVVNDGGEFQHLVTLMKSWAVPFDILRLDQQKLDADRLDRYGAVLWDVPAELAPRDLGALARAVENDGISLIALGNRIQPPELQRLLGIRWRSEHLHGSHVMVSRADSFLMRDSPADLFTGGPEMPFRNRVQVISESAEVLAMQGGMPQITERILKPETRAIWIGGDINNMLQYPAVRRTLRRAVTEAIGYALVRTWEKHVILTMDDLGNAQNAWLEHWHYPALSQEQIRKYMIDPLRAHGAILSINAVPGFVDDTARRVVPSWRQKFVDAFGTPQDYISTRRGIDEGVAAGVFEIESHGWTHMQPDLDSPPGPWWGSDLDGERAEVGWYREFFDTRRNREIPAAEQRFHMTQSRDWIRRQFRFDPLEFATGGNAVSVSLDNNTWRIAAEAGFGYYGGYLGRDLAVQGKADSTAEFGGSEDVPLVLPAPPDGHDRGMTKKPGEFAAVFDKYPGYVFTGFDEYIGYLHTEISGGGSSGIEIRLDYDPHYCRALIAKGSEWKLHVSDWLRESTHPSEVRINGTVSGKPPGEWTMARFPKGSARNVIAIQ